MSQPLTPAAGSKVGRYTLAAEVADLFSAPTFVARSQDGQTVRVSLLPRAGTDADAAQKAATNAKNLTHAHVLKLLDLETIEGRFVLSTEHVEGVSLQTLVQAAGANGLGANVATRIALDALEALGAAHDAGLVHGELGPHLIWVGMDGKARVTGLGVARALGKALAPKTPSDRLSYVAPERVKVASTGAAAAADAKCDVFSTAVICWELFAKKRLFSARLESAVVQKVLTAQIAPLAAAADDLPDGVDEALKKALERDPAKRTATAKELADALSGAFDGKVASHEDVAKVMDELAKKQVEELRTKVAAAAAAADHDDGSLGPSRPSLPTLDPDFIEEEVAKPVVKVMGAKPPPVPPKPPPRAPVKPVEVKVTEVKPADAKPAEAKADGDEGAKAADAKPDSKPEDKPADEKATDAKVADAKAADAKAGVPKVGDKAGLVKPAPGRVAIPKVEAKVPSKVGPAIPSAPVKKAAEPRKGTLLGVAPPSPLAAGEKATADKEKASGADSADAAADEGVAGASSAAEAAPAEKATTPKPTPVEEAGAAASNNPEAGKAESAEAAAKPADGASKDGEAAAASDVPASKPPVSGGTKVELERTPSSGGNGSSKRKPMPGNLEPGDALGRYELLLPVAAGGMAAVWAARLQGTAGFQKIVAIKTMLPGLSADQDFEEMFLDEARVAARIRHPNVVEIFDLGEEGETLYLVMEWVDGETLGALQKAAKGQGGIPLPILLRIASQACAGLHAAHELRDDKGALVDLVHRDISPANVLVSKTGFVKIVDFGVAKSKARMYTTRVGGMLKGKTPYLSPEQLGAQQIDRRSDLYSFGAVLYVLATGLHPFRGETEAKTIENIALRDPVPLRKIDPNIHPELEAIILKALEKDRDKRFESASEMQRAIDTLAASIGQTVNDDDVAAFVRKVAGEGLDKRATALRDAIALADTNRSAPPTSRGARVEPNDDAAKVEIDDVDIDADEKPKAAEEKAAPVVADKPSEARQPEISALSLGSDVAPVSPPVDTLAAASTEPSDEFDAQPRKKKPLLIVGAVLGVCALIGIAAIAGGGGGKSGTESSKPVAANTSVPARVGATEPAPAATPTASEAATAEPAATPEPSSAPAPTAEATATAAPTATAEPVAAAPTTTPPTKAAPTTKTAPATKPTVATKPTAAPKPTTKPATKPIKKFEPTGL
ncbi:MAG: protein kinase [Polyangiaceae bacterium]|nr:protein kinase [Polyangiaceae bacterium]